MTRPWENMELFNLLFVGLLDYYFLHQYNTSEATGQLSLLNAAQMADTKNKVTPITK